MKTIASKVVGVGLLALVASCVPDRNFDPKLAAPDDDSPTADLDAGTADDMAPSELCQDYCTSLAQNCEGDDAAYSTQASCEAVCALLEQSEAETSSSDDDAPLQCRARNARVGVEGPGICLVAGPAGRESPADSVKCDDPCNAYCALYVPLCEPKLALDECQRQCAAVPDHGGYSLKDNYYGDTVQCRLVHLEAAVLGDTSHCIHARVGSPEKCNNSDETPACEDYCTTVMASCEGANAVYEDRDACMAACNALSPGKASDTNANTVGCRHYHAYNALGAAKVHCPHAGPAGDGHCGGAEADGPSGNCESYCRLARVACEATYDNTFADDDACQLECESWDGAARNSGYAVNEPDKLKVVQCRIHQAVSILASGKEDGCDAVFRGSPCQ